MASRQKRLVHKKRWFFDFNWLPWQCPLRNQKRGPDRSSTNKYLSFGAKTAKIGPPEPEILRLWVKKYCKTQNWLPWQRSLRYWKKIRSITYTQNAFIWCKNCKNRTWFVFYLRHKIGCYGNVPWGIREAGPDPKNSCKYLPFSEKNHENRSNRYWDSYSPMLIVKKRKKEEINASKIYSPVDNLAERAKLPRMETRCTTEARTDDLWPRISHE